MRQDMLVFLVSIAGFIPYVAAESCFYQRCLNCHPEETVAPGRSVNCEPSTWVSPHWIHNYGYPPPTTDSKIPIEYRCLKMVATPDDKSFGNTVDVLRGCVPRAQVDSVCSGLEAVERARGHSDARCSVCYGNNCNSSPRLQTLPIHVAVTSILLHFLISRTSG